MFFKRQMALIGQWPRERAQTTRLASFGPLVSFFLIRVYLYLMFYLGPTDILKEQGGLWKAAAT